MRQRHHIVVVAWGKPTTVIGISGALGYICAIDVMALRHGYILHQHGLFLCKERGRQNRSRASDYTDGVVGSPKWSTESSTGLQKGITRKKKCCSIFTEICFNID